ncbi:uracil-DNA glycosylase family protein [Roseomonas chloroacetimidivorans]|uniref:uracil-DNA glycosylase family protein n=1 Tax=Roseomonas chloroacetimidivorans TaxID=1766656 RepID=UPI003C75BE1D
MTSATVNARDPGIPADATMLEVASAARACTLCAPDLPLGPRPIHQLHEQARIVITSQAPGTKAHLSGIPFEDASGERLRDWLGLGRDRFYDPSLVAIMPMGMCYPGRLPRGGDAPPRPECAPLWHPRILPRFENVRLRLLVGAYAIRFVLGPGMPLAERVARYAETLPTHFPLPHPSWRTLVWAKRNAWFDTTVIPALRREVARALEGAGAP